MQRVLVAAIVIMTTMLSWGFCQNPGTQNAAKQQDEKKQQQDQQKIGELDQYVTYPQDIIVDWGFWFQSSYSTFDDDPVRENRTLRLQDLRLWGRTRVGDDGAAYARIQNQYIDYNEGDQFGLHDNKFKPFRLDQGYLSYRLNNMFMKGDTHSVTAGRQFFSVGRGIVVYNNADGVQTSSNVGGYVLHAFAFRTIHGIPDIDQSRPQPNYSRRFFGGIEVTSPVKKNHKAYGYIVSQVDRNSEIPVNALIDFGYNSTYFGAGFKGNPFPWLAYQAEGIYETGRSHSDFVVGEQNISARAAAALLQILPQYSLRPICFTEYLYASGDADRTNPINTVGGNKESSDTSFVPFGFSQTGFSFFPRLSNIRVWRTGVSLQPFALTNGILKRTEVGLQFYKYWKDEASAGIGDFRAVNNHSNLGREYDFYVRMRLTSDIGLQLQYGRFYEGAAYDETEPRDYFLLGVSITG